jgi:murein DD-endopeptidase MepM/ murein hydrolase activator NlpD
MWIVLILAGALVPAGQWPVDSPVVTRPYAPPSAQWHSGHRGVDLAAQPGQTARAMADGTVGFVGVIGGVPVVTVRYPGEDHRRSTFQPVIGTVVAGQQVRQGDVIGTVAGLGGHCGGSTCLHVGLRTDDRYLDPAALVASAPAILKPALPLRQ